MKRRPWLIPVMVAAVVRLIYLLAFPQREPHGDDLYYWQMAQSLAHGDGYVIDGQPTVFWMPGLSVLLSPLALIFGAALLPTRLLLVTLSIVTVYVVWRLARAWFGEGIGLWSAWAFALFPPFWFFSTAILTETLAILLVATLLLLVTELKGGFEWKRAVGVGLCYGGLMYLKPEFAFWGPFLAAATLLWRKQVAPKTVAVMGVVGVLMLVPWTARNWIDFQEFIPLKGSGGLLVWWVSQDPPVESLDERTPEQKATELTFEVPGKPGASGKNAARAGFARLAQHPLQYVKRCFTRRLVHLFVGSQTEAASGVGLARSFGDLRASHERARLAVKMLLFVLQGLIAALGILGVAMLGSNTIRMLFFGSVGIYMLLLGIPRYSMVLMPFLIPHGAALIAHFRRRNPK
jgi:4-amino-4-deoxy-L-arabinose transferase-like glycosyltransferase